MGTIIIMANTILTNLKEIFSERLDVRSIRASSISYFPNSPKKNSRIFQALLSPIPGSTRLAAQFWSNVHL